MSPTQILRGKGFKVVKEVHTDGKNRVTLPKDGHPDTTYRVYTNEIGQIILDPVVSIPASELWVHKDKDARESIQKGLKESAEGKIHKLPSLAKHAEDSLED